MEFNRTGDTNMTDTMDGIDMQFETDAVYEQERKTLAAKALIVRNVRYSDAAGDMGFGDMYIPKDWTADKPVVLLIHGGGWSGMDRKDVVGIADFLVEALDCIVFNINYRLASQTPWPACGDDCRAAADFLLRQSATFMKTAGSAQRPKIWVIGGSSGGHLALWTGLSLPSERVAGIVSISGIADPEVDYPAHPGMYRGLFGTTEVTKAQRDSMSVMNLIKPNGPRILLTHATVDDVVPIETARSFEAAYRAAGNDIGFFEYPSNLEEGLTGHCIWRADSHPHRLLARLEREIEYFMTPSAIPAPEPVKSDIELTAFYYPGTEHRPEWDMMAQTYPGTRPLLGWYDEGDPENIDWQIKWAVEHGISSFCVDWYWNMGVRRLEHWVQAFYRAKFRSYFKWYIMYANHNAPGSHSTPDQIALTRFWIDNYFKTPEYYKLDGKPVVVIWQWNRLDEDFIAEAAANGETLAPGEGLRRAFAISEKLVAEAGLPGIHWINMRQDQSQTAEAAAFLKSLGIQEQMNYNLGGSGLFHFVPEARRADDTPRRYSFDLMCAGALKKLYHGVEEHPLPVLPLLPTGWNDVPRSFQNAVAVYGRTPEKFRGVCRQIRQYCEERGVKRVVVAPVNEWQEGSYIEPNEEYGFGMYDALREVFCTKTADGWPKNLRPQDVGRPLLEFPPMNFSAVQSWTFEKTTGGWYRQPYGCQKTLVKNGVLWFLTTHVGNFQIRQRLVPFAAARYSAFALRMKITRNAAWGADAEKMLSMRLKWGTTEKPVIAEDMSVDHNANVAHAPILPDGKWHEYRVPLAPEHGWRGDVDELWFEAADERGCIAEIAWMRFE